jgi:hypothetical protein
VKMSGTRAALSIVLLGLITFGVVFTLLEFSRSQAAPAETQAAPAVVATDTLTLDSIASTISPGHVAVALPITGSEALLRDVQPGDRLDVLASFSSPQNTLPVTSVVARGAIVIRPATPTDPLLVEVLGTDALALAHLVSSGTHLGYTVWSASGGSVAAQTQVLDQTTARRLLGLSTPPEASPTVAPSPSNTPVPGSQSGFLYQVQPGDTWQSVASLFTVPLLRLRELNEAQNEPDPVPGRLIFIPRTS